MSSQCLANLLGPYKQNVIVHSCFSFTYVDIAVVVLLVDCDIGLSYALVCVCVCVLLVLVCVLLLTHNNKKTRDESVRERQLFPTVGRDKTAALLYPEVKETPLKLPPKNVISSDCSIITKEPGASARLHSGEPKQRSLPDGCADP